MSEDRRITDQFKDDLHELVKKVVEMSETLVRIEEKLLRVDEHHQTLYGNNGSPGLIKVVDRLDQVERSRERHLGAIYTLIVGLWLKAFWGVLVGSKVP